MSNTFSDLFHQRAVAGAPQFLWPQHFATERTDCMPTRRVDHGRMTMPDQANTPVAALGDAAAGRLVKPVSGSAIIIVTANAVTANANWQHGSGHA
ncbi:MAG: hypothetical protein LC637_09100 [Xanthomonadaceae bacterium]|nr:hypothetical protein [Xanthomonadaceae bacterium]